MSKTGRRAGYLISFEGLDGAGKTTQLHLLADWLASTHKSFIRTREPGGTALGAEIRRLLLHTPELTITPLAETLLFQADRAQHFAQVVLPALAEGKIVITDRCFDSSIAYQGVARNVGSELVERLSLIATQGHQPDLTLLLDLDPAMVSRRTEHKQDQHQAGEQQSHFDTESLQFHHRLRSAFLALARAHPERIKVIDASRPIAVIHREIVALVERLLMKTDNR